MRSFLRRVDETFLRRYLVTRPGDPDWRTRRRVTFFGARRAARRARGTRIFKPNALAFRSVDYGWSESRNGYIRYCPHCGYPEVVPTWNCPDCMRGPRTYERETGFLPLAVEVTA